MARSRFRWAAFSLSLTILVAILLILEIMGADLDPALLFLSSVTLVVGLLGFLWVSSRSSKGP